MVIIVSIYNDICFNMAQDEPGKHTRYITQVRLAPGDEFRINQDGRAIVSRWNGETKAFSPHEEQFIIRITV